jgi:hypothetical protein
MSRTREIIDSDVESGLQTIRENATRAGAAGAEAARSLGQNLAANADARLSEYGFAPAQISDTLAENAELARQDVLQSSRKSRKELARNAQETRKELAKRAEAVRKQARVEAKKEAKKAGKKGAKGGRKAAKQTSAVRSARRGPPRLLIALGVAGVAGGVAYLLRQRAAQRVAAEQDRLANAARPGAPEADGKPGANGKATAPNQGLSSN